VSKVVASTRLCCNPYNSLYRSVPLSRSSPDTPPTPTPTPTSTLNPPPGAPPDLSSWLRREAETDREAMEKATRAFVSFVRGYKEHQLRYIFRIQVGGWVDGWVVEWVS